MDATAHIFFQAASQARQQPHTFANAWRQVLVAQAAKRNPAPQSADATRLASGLAHGTAPVSLRVPGLLTQLYTTPDAPAMQAFLNAHPFLSPLLLEAYSHIRAEFAQAPLFLEVFTDPEWPEQRQLLITISPLCPPAEALVRYRRLQQDWWLAVMPHAVGALALMVEYR